MEGNFKPKRDFKKRPQRDRDDDSMDDGDGGSRKLMGGGHSRKKACRFCADDEYILDYKNVRVVQSFMSEHGRIVPRRISGCCASHQRKLTTAIKRARNLALVGFVTPGN